jgi:hypothetical protein
MSFLSPKTPSTQEHLEVEDIKDDLVILKNGMVSLVMEVSSINFDLLSEREQDIKIMGFTGLLNSLNFQIQIVIKTEKTDISNYLDKLRVYREKQISNALKRQIDIYMRFITNLAINKEVLAKKIYVVIPEIVGTAQRTSMVKQVFGKPNKITNVKPLLDGAKPKLYPKRDHLIKQFKRIGLIARQLTSDQLTRLYYSMYDPDKIGVSKLQLGTSEFTASMVKPK